MPRAVETVWMAGIELSQCSTGVGRRGNVTDASSQTSQVGEGGGVGIAGIDADLEVDDTRRPDRAVEQRRLTESGSCGDIVDGLFQFLEFGIVGSERLCVVDAFVGRVFRQSFHLDENSADFVHGGFAGLHHGNGLIGVRDGCLQAGNVGPLVFGDHQTGRTVTGTVDLQTGRQPFERTVQHVVGPRHAVLSVQGGNVVDD
ncbi:MAG: hypothetical protein KatS3mg105_4271 [Gemmatales bacterium]|nr:MAG: hypothetical protein KatS3mg105_4271 [Gemmatales bacterium]